MKITISALLVICISQKSRCKLFFRTECINVYLNSYKKTSSHYECCGVDPTLVTAVLVFLTGILAQVFPSLFPSYVFVNKLTGLFISFFILFLVMHIVSMSFPNLLQSRDLGKQIRTSQVTAKKYQGYTRCRVKSYISTCANLSANQSRFPTSTYRSDWLGDLRTQKCTSLHGIGCTLILFLTKKFK